MRSFGRIQLHLFRGRTCLSDTWSKANKQALPNILYYLTLDRTKYQMKEMTVTTAGFPFFLACLPRSLDYELIPFTFAWARTTTSELKLTHPIWSSFFWSSFSPYSQPTCPNDFAWPLVLCYEQALEDCPMWSGFFTCSISYATQDDKFLWLLIMLDLLVYVALQVITK